ncbi:apolipoprotein D-like isoform X2 [Plodia interpunctella]|uniref:apolipoprotein D-like isoform X2 n=1 Tax=Plodia interpunctella TaxID=58824 RepID=UPI0023689E1A|nr:apolipoprotein D-like isoform X2 [Plodia interpunctella]
MGDFRVNAGALCFLLLCVGPATNTGLGRCPVYPQLPNFDISKMTGTWYEVERSFYLMELSASCTELHVSLNEKGYLLISINTVNRLGRPSASYGLGIPSHNGSSLFRYKVNNRMPYIIGRLLPGAGLYNILFTDYNRFALVWSCTSLTVAHSDRIWVLGRKREIPAELRAQIYALMAELRLDPDRLIISKNNNCSEPKLPAIN